MAGHCNVHKCGIHSAVTDTDCSENMGASGAVVYGTYSCDNACNAYRTSYFRGSRRGACRCDGAFECVERALYPVIVTTQTIPVTAIAPLFVLWLGYGIWSKVLVAVLITFFPITISVHDGLKSAKRENEELLRTMGMSGTAIFFKLKFPAALPSFFSAIKMAIPLSILGAAMGEWLGAQSGLGYFSKRMMTQLDGAGVFAPVVVLAVCAMLVVAVISAIERKLITWRKEI